MWVMKLESSINYALSAALFADQLVEDNLSFNGSGQPQASGGISFNQGGNAGLQLNELVRSGWPDGFPRIQKHQQASQNLSSATHRA